MKKFSFFLLILIFFLSSPGSSSAADREVVCKESGCKIDTDSAIFDYTDIYPNWSKSKEVKITNKYPKPINVYIDLSDHSFKNTDFDSVFDFKIERDGKLIYGPVTLEKFEKKGKVKLGVIKENSNKIFTFKINMKDVGNEYQAKSIKFDLDLKFEAEEFKEGVKETKKSGDYISYVNNVLGLSTTKPSDFKNPLVETELNGNKDNTDKVLGSSDCKSNFWWLLPYLLLILLLFVQTLFSVKYIKFIILVATVASAYFIHINICGLIFTVLALCLGLLTLLDLRKLIYR